MGKKFILRRCSIGLLCAGALFALVSNVAAAAEQKVKVKGTPKIGQFSTEDPGRLKDQASSAPYTYTYIPYAPTRVNVELGMTGLVAYSNTTGLALINPRNMTISDIMLNHLGDLGSDGGGRYDLAMTRDGRTALISNFGDSTVYIVDLSGGSPVVSGRVTIDFFAEDIAIDPSGKWALVTDGGFTNRVGVIHIPTRTLLTYHEDDDDDSSTPMENDDTFPAEPDVPLSWRIFNAMDPDDPLDDMSGYANSVDIAADGRTVIVSDYFGGQINVLLFDPSDGSLSLEQSETLWRQGQDGTETSPYRYWPVNTAISPDGRTVLVANASNSEYAMDLNEGCNMAVFYIDRPGHVLRTPDVLFPITFYYAVITGGQSIVFSRDGHKAFYHTIFWDEQPTPPEGLTPEEEANWWNYEYWTYPEIQVIRMAGAGQASWTGSIRLPTRRGTSQLFGVDIMATSPDGNFLYVTNPTTSGASPVIDVVNLRTLSLARQIGTPTDYPDPLHPEDPSHNYPIVIPVGIAFPEAPVNLGVSLDLGEGKAPVDEEFEFQVVLNNQSVGRAFHIDIGSSLPEGLEIVSAEADTGSWDAAGGVWAIDELGHWDQAVLTITAVCSEPGNKTVAFFINRQAGYDPDGSDNRAEGVIRVVGKADLAINAESSSATPIVSTPFTVNLRAINAGPLAGVDVTVNQPLPSGWTVLGSSGEGSYNRATGLWTIGSLPVGATATLQLSLQSSALGGTILTFPIRDSGSYDPDGSNNETSLSIQIVKVAPPLEVGVQMLENDLVFTKETLNKINWRHNPVNSAVSGYRIYYKIKGSSSAHTLLTTTAASVTEYAHRNLERGQAYSYRISAVNGNGDESPTVTVEN